MIGFGEFSAPSRSTSSVPLMQKKLNARFLLVVIVLMVVLGSATAVIHRVQRSRIADGYFAQADNARKESRPDQEVNFLQRFLALQPSHSEARVRLGLAMAELAKRPEELTDAYFILQEALLNDSTLPVDVRRTAIRLALAPGQNLQTEALRDIELLLKVVPDDAEMLDFKGQCLALRGSNTEADQAYATAIQKSPTRIATYARRANLLRYVLGRKDEADRLIDHMSVVNKNVALAHITAAEYWLRASNTARAEQSIKFASLIDDQDPLVMFTRIDHELQKTSIQPDTAIDRWKKAKSDLSRMLDKLLPNMPAAQTRLWSEDPDAIDPRGLVSETFLRLTNVLAKLGDFQEAEQQSRRAMQTFPGSSIHILNHVDILIRNNKTEEAEQRIVLLQNSNIKSGLLDYHRGRIAALQNRWIEACRLLESASLDLANRSASAREAQLMLAKCYEFTGDLPSRYEAYRRAVPDDVFDPAFVPAVQGLARALVDLGRHNEAIIEYRRLLTRSPAAAIPLARLSAAQLLRQPTTTSEQWSAIDATLAKAPPGLERDLASATIAAARGHHAAAEKSFEQLAQKYPKSVELWSIWLTSVISHAEFDKASSLLDRAKRECGETPEIIVLGLRTHARGDRKVFASLVQKLADGITSLPYEQRTERARLIAGLALEAENRPLARKLLDQVQKQETGDLRLLYQRFDLALLEGDEPALNSLLTQFETMTGSPDSIESRTARGFFALSKASRGDSKALVDAGNLLASVAKEREVAARPQVGLGRVAELKGDKAEAARRYRRALELGERSPEVVRRLLEAYSDLKQFSEAETVLKMVADAGIVLRGGEGVAAELMAGARNYVQAAEMAVKAVPQNSTDHRQLMWLAQMLTLAGKTNEAVPVLRRATVIAPEASESWLFLVQSLARLNQLDEAKTVLEQAKQKLRSADALLSLPVGYEFVGMRDQAARAYLEALKTRPHDPAVLRAVSTFRMRTGDVEGAIPILESMLNLPGRSDDDVKFARRSLGLCLAISPQKENAQRGLALLGIAANGNATPISPLDSTDDLRARATVLALMNGRTSRLSCLAVMEAIEARGPLSAADLFLFGKVQSALGEWTRAKERMRAAAESDPTNALYASQLVLMHLRLGEVSEARRWAERVVALSPGAARSFELLGRVAMADGNPSAALAEIEKLNAMGVDAKLVGSLLESIGLPEKAEPYFRKIAANARSPQEMLLLPGYLARTGRTSESIAEIERLWERLPLDLAVGNMVETMMIAPNASKTLIDRVTQRVVEACTKDRNYRVMLVAMKCLVDDYHSAAELTRTMLAENPNDPIALNNLAYLTGIVERNPLEGMRHISQAIEQAGRKPTLLDTQAVICIAMGKSEQAIDLLLEVVVDEPTAVSYYHLAQAYQAAGQIPNARKALVEAQRLNLKITELFPYERKQYQAFIGSIGR